MIPELPRRLGHLRARVTVPLGSREAGRSPASLETSDCSHILRRHADPAGSGPLAPPSGSFRPSDSIGVFPLVVQGFPPLMVYYLDMSSIVGKRQGNHTYYYLVESARVDGKPRIVSQQYLGSAAEVMAKLSGSAAGEPVRAQYRSFGDLAAVWSMLERLHVAAIIDAVVPRYASAAASVGTYMALATANRIVAPCSKLAFADWWDTTAGPRWVKIRGGVVDHRRFWDAMDRLDEPSLRTIETALGRRIVSEFGVDLSGLVLDMTNFATYIDSTNDKAPIAQRGKAKQKRTDLRLVGLALVVTRDGGIPLVSHAYAGDRLDVTQFSTVITELIARYRELVLSATLGEDDRVVVGRHDEDGFLRSCAAPWWRGTGFGQVTGGATARV